MSSLCRIFATALLFTFFTARAEEQLFINGTKDYSRNSDRTDYLYILRRWGDDFVAIGGAPNSKGRLSPRALLLRDDGSVIWDIDINPDGETVYDAVPLLDGSLAVVGNVLGPNGSSASTGLSFVNKDGTVATQRNFPGYVTDGVVIVEPAGGCTIAAAVQGQIQLVRLDASRQIELQKEVPAGVIYWPAATSLFRTSGGGYLLTWATSEIIEDQFVVTWHRTRLDSAFEVISSKDYPFYGLHSRLLSDGRIAVLAHEQVFLGDFSFIQFIAPDGSLAGQSERFSPSISRFQVAPGDDVWLTANTTTPARSPELVHLSPTGKIISRTVFTVVPEYSGFVDPLVEGGRVKLTGPAFSTLTELAIEQLPDGAPEVLVGGDRRKSYVIEGKLNYDFAIRQSGPPFKLFYTLDGSTNLADAIPYTPFSVVTLNQSATLRALALDANGTLLASVPISVQFRPDYFLTLGQSPAGFVEANPYRNPRNIFGTQLPENSEVGLLAKPSEGWSFLHWAGDLGGTENPRTIVLRTNMVADAVFGTPLSIFMQGTGEIIRSENASLYPFGDRVAVAALPGPDSYFSRWSDLASGPTPFRSFDIASPTQTVTAIFEALPAGKVAFTFLANGRGTVTSSHAIGALDPGQRVTLKATPDAGSHFLGWSGSTNSFVPDITIDVQTNTQVIASFSDGIRSLFLPQVELRAFNSPGTRPTLEVITRPDAKVAVEQSTDLKSWSTVASQVLTNGLLELPINGTNNQFFRGIVLP